MTDVTKYGTHTAERIPLEPRNVSEGFDLSLVPAKYRPGVLADINAGRDEVVTMLPAYVAMDFLLCNIEQLKTRGTYEELLLDVYVGVKGSWHEFTEDELAMCFEAADRGRLRAAGDPLPAGDTFTVYRGVAGDGPARRPRGLSWTLCPGIAAWFAGRMDLPNPAVLEATVDPDAILAACNGRLEQELIVSLPDDVHPQPVLPMPAERNPNPKLSFQERKARLWARLSKSSGPHEQ